MKILLLFAFILPSYSAVEFIVDVREFEKGIKREIYVRDATYRVRLSKESKDLKMREALPIFTLTEFAACSRKNLTPLRTNSQFEPSYIEAYHKCGSKESMDNWKKRNRLEEICTDRFIETKAQEILCKELGLYK